MSCNILGIKSTKLSFMLSWTDSFATCPGHLPLAWPASSDFANLVLVEMDIKSAEDTEENASLSLQSP